MELLTTIIGLLENLNPEKLLTNAGEYAFYIVLFVIFAETGLFFGFFLPGDSLLFVAGLFCRSGQLTVGLPVLLISLMIAGILGNMTGYFTGAKMGRGLFEKDTLFFKKKYLHTTEDFYARYGTLALILGRFLPIVRTFAPILAGIIKMDFKKFLVYNIIGSVAWVASITSAGYALGEIKWIREHIEVIVILLIVLTIIPVIRTYFVAKKNMANRTQEKVDL
ncbi:MAG: VTT domain-containing protein [Bacteroidetes bacterium]|nr:VTT domain-containing protein [Bacteroidota bacterium]